MGAAQFLFPEGNEELLEHCSSYAQEGYRILVLAHSEQETKGTERPTGLEPLGLFLITDVIREEAPNTLHSATARCISSGVLIVVASI